MTENNNSGVHPLGEDVHKKYDLNRQDTESPAMNEADIKELHRVDLSMHKRLKERADLYGEELLAGFEAIESYPKSVTIFGSARTKEDEVYYQKARSIAGKICKEGFAVLTGGGPGAMEAANRGAYEACGYSIGFNIKLPFEQSINPYVTHGLDFEFFSSRKTAMMFSAEAYLYMPGGFGTMDELFQMLTLIQTHKAPPTPIILVGSDFWNPLEDFIKSTLQNEFKTISAEDRDLYVILDDEEQILDIVKNAPRREEYDQ